ncbi:MAG TPA: type IV pilus assembly protein PilM [Micromonosporaceae bacterium]|nr:type IV pilus assembly protein PilM [Micromonosporaceae bacterium]
MATGTLIGLDIGAMSIRAVETDRGKGGPVITSFGQTQLPPGTVRNGVIHDGPAVTAALKELWGTNQFGSRDVILGLTNPQVVVREMSVSNLPGRKMRDALPFQVRDMLPLPVERSILDFYPLEDPGTNEMVRGLLIAAPKDAVLAAIAAIELAGLRVSKVDLASFALLRAASHLDGQVEAIVDIGAQASSVIVHIDGEPLIVRTIPRGGADITEMMATQLEIPAADAETLKCRIGLVSDAEPDTAKVIQEAVRPLITEIRSSFAYLTTSDRQSRVTRLALTGGGSLLPGLAEALGTQLNVEVVAADPVQRLRDRGRGRHNSLERFRSAAAVAIGLTLGAT